MIKGRAVMQGTHQSYHDESEMRCSFKKKNANKLIWTEMFRNDQKMSRKFPEGNAGVPMEIERES